MDEFEDTETTLHWSPGKRGCAEYALVLRSVGIGCEVSPLDGGFALVVAADDAARAREQIELYRRENPARPRRFASPSELARKVSEGLNCAFIYGAVLLLVDVLQRRGAFGLDWWQAGLARADLIRQGEWWRTVTALSLHGDGHHLIGNLIFGTVFGFLAGLRLGWGTAWLGMILAGALGNAVNALVRAPGHSSVGASTAVFAALGMLAVTAWIGWERPINRWAPLGGGVALLAFVGMGGERTDIVAHVAGFATGGLLGALLAGFETRLERLLRHQLALGAAGVGLLAIAWWAALAG